MSQTPQTASSSLASSNFRAIFYASMKEYQKKTKQDLLSHPLMDQLQTCNTPTDILAVLRTQVQKFEQSTSGDENLTKWLTPTVNVLYAFSEVLGVGVGLVFSPASVIFAGAGVLLSTAKDVLASQDTFVYIFERIEGFFRRLETYTDVPTMEGMKDVIMKIMVEVLGIFAIVTKEMKQGRAKKYLKKLIGRRDLEDALNRLDRLTQEEAWMANAQVLKVAHRVEDGVKIVGEQVKDVDVRVKGVDDKVDVVIEDGKVVKVTTMETKTLVQQTANKMDEAHRSQVRTDHRAWLSPPDPSTNHNITCSAQHEGTATWFLQGSKSEEWKSKSATTSLLWIHGKPGSGKSVLCSAIVQDIMALREAGLATMAYYYFDFRDTDKQNLHNALRSLLTQLSARSDGCCDILSRIHKAHDNGAHKPSTSTMIACLKEMLALPGQPIYIILDALDECPKTFGIPSARTQVLDLLKDIVGLQLTDLHICVTSRPEIDIRAVLEPLAFHSVSIHDQNGQRRDIGAYIRSVVYADSDTAMRRWRDQDKELVIETLTERADGMFRWVFCQLEVLQHCFPKSIRKTLNELPKSLDETYERVLREISMANRDYAHRLLQCLAVAIRPLRIEELAEILALDFEEAEGATPTLNKDWRWEDRQRAVLSTCSSLITLVDDGFSRIIQFSHFSVKEFLTSNRLATSKGDVSHFHIIPEPAHTTLAQACLGTLLQLDGSSNNSRIEASFPLASYASRHWVEHAQFGMVSSRIVDGMRRLFDSAKPYFSTWLQLHNVDEVVGVGSYAVMFFGSPLYYASLCGFRDLAAHIIVEQPEQVNSVGGHHRSPLAAALHKRHFEVAELLHQHGAATSGPSYPSRNPLQAASEKGFTDVAQWLLDHGADANSQTTGHLTPINLAAANGHLEIVWMLLKHNVRIDAANNRGRTPLHLASNNGHVEIVRVLLQHGADISAQDEEFSTSLHLASDGKLEVVRVLLDRVADVDAQNEGGLTPLHLASSSGRAEIMRLLLDRGANVNAEDKDGWTPLHLATTSGRKEPVRLLLDHGANVDAKNKGGRTPLHLASPSWEAEIVDLLLNRGANTNAEDNDGWTPLHLASYDGSTDIVRLLLDRGASTNVRNKAGMTPLQVTSWEEREIVGMLIEHGAQVYRSSESEV